MAPEEQACLPQLRLQQSPIDGEEAVLAHGQRMHHKPPTFCQNQRLQRRVQRGEHHHSVPPCGEGTDAVHRTRYDGRAEDHLRLRHHPSVARSQPSQQRLPHVGVRVGVAVDGMCRPALHSPRQFLRPWQVHVCHPHRSTVARVVAKVGPEERAEVLHRERSAPVHRAVEERLVVAGLAAPLAAPLPANDEAHHACRAHEGDDTGERPSRHVRKACSCSTQERDCPLWSLKHCSHTSYSRAHCATTSGVAGTLSWQPAHSCEPVPRSAIEVSSPARAGTRSGPGAVAHPREPLPAASRHPQGGGGGHCSLRPGPLSMQRTIPRVTRLRPTHVSTMPLREVGPPDRMPASPP